MVRSKPNLYTSGSATAGMHHKGLPWRAARERRCIYNFRIQAIFKKGNLRSSDGSSLRKKSENGKVGLSNSTANILLHDICGGRNPLKAVIGTSQSSSMNGIGGQGETNTGLTSTGCSAK